MNFLLLKNSLLVSSLATVLATSFGFGTALFMMCLPRGWRNLFFALAIIALALPPFLVTNCWLQFLGHTGAWRSWLPLNIFTPGGTVWLLSLLLWPITVFGLWGAWQRLEPEQLESDMGVTGWALVRGCLLPLSKTALGQTAVISFVLALMNFAVPAILQVKVFPAEMWVRFNTSFDVPGTLKLSWPLILAPLLLLVCLLRRELPWPHRESPIASEFFRQQLGYSWFYVSGFGSILLCVASVGLPLLQILFTKRTWTELPGAFAAGQSAVWNSFWFASLAAATVIGVSVLMGIWSVALSRHGMQIGERPSKENLMRPLPNVFSAFVWIAFLLPGVLLGIVLITLFNRPWLDWLYHSAAIVLLAYGLRYFALGWTCVLRANQSVDPDLVNIAQLEGATAWQMFRYVQWPQIAPRVAAAWYVVFLLCLWDVESIILVVPPGGETLAVRIFNLLHYGHNAQVNALCFTLLCVALLPLILWQFWSVLRPSFCTIARHAFQLIQHAAPITLLSLGTTSLLTSCAPSSQSNDAAIQSKLFSRVQIIGSRGVGVGQLNKPRSVAVDAQDNLYVVDMTGRVQKFSSNGVFVLSWQMPQTDLGKPKGMCRDRAGNIVVVEPHYSRVNHFTPSGELVLQWGERGTNSGQLSLPRAVAVNSHNEIFVSEYQEAERVQKFDLPPLNGKNPARGDADSGDITKSGGFSGETIETSKTAEAAGRSTANSHTPLKLGVKESGAIPLASFGRAGTAPGEFNRPEGLCLDQQDRLYVADSCNHRIEVFSSDGKFLRSYGKPGKGLGELSYPYDVCVDSLGRQYVCEFGNSRIQVFDAHDQPLEIIGGPGAEPGHFSNPWGVALDSAGNLYVADSQNHRVQKFIRKPANEIASSP